MVRKRVGILTGNPGKNVTPENDIRIDGSKKQFKYRKIFDIHKTFPDVSVGSQTDLPIVFNYKSYIQDIDYIPAYEFYVRGYNGRWGVPNIQSPQAYSHSYINFPYYSNQEYIDETQFSTTLRINNLSVPGAPAYDYPQHEVIVRLIIFYDPLEDIT